MKNFIKKGLLLIVPVVLLLPTGLIAQNAISFYDYYGSATQAISVVDIYLDSVNVPYYTNTPTPPFGNGEYNYEMRFELNSPNVETWTVGRELICLEDMTLQPLWETVCIKNGCYGIASMPNVIQDYKFQDFTSSVSTSRYRIKPGLSSIDITKKSYYEIKLYVGTGTRNANAEFIFDNKYYGEIPVKVHINGGNCSTNPTAVNDLEKKSINMSIYPNPSTGSNITIMVEDNFFSNEYSYSIQNLTGQKLINGKSSKGTFDVEVSKLSSGLYYVNVLSKKTGAMVVRQFVVK